MENRILEKLEPNRVFYYFEEISRIPHGSGNIRKIGDYLVSFGRNHGISFRQDKVGNVVFCKPASKGYENVPGIILQGHMDMVAVKEPNVSKNMETEGLDLIVEGDDLHADHTSLGGDDGIAVAYMLALLENDELPHPLVECIVTVDEETGMNGAREIDLSDLKGKRLFNLDSENEGHLLCSCAGGATFKIRFPFKRETHSGKLIQLTISGLKGGHSGTEIIHERGNAILLLNRALRILSEKIPVQLVSFHGGEKENAIPNSAEAEFLTEPTVSQECLDREIQKIQDLFAAELNGIEDRINLKVTYKDCRKLNVLDSASQNDLLGFLTVLPAGVQSMSGTMKGLVETSLNLGVLRMEESCAEFCYSCRSSIESRKTELLTKLKLLCEKFDAEYSVSGNYPGWQYQPESPFRDLVCEEYQNLTEKEMQVEAIHAGVECGFFLGKRPELDAVSIGPDMFDIHTTKERLSISSTARTWQLICNVLARKP